MFLMAAVLGIRPQFAIYVKNQERPEEYDLQKDSISEDCNKVCERVTKMKEEEGIECGMLVNLMFENHEFPDCVQIHKPEQQFKTDPVAGTAMN